MSYNPHSFRVKSVIPDEFEVSTKFLGPYDKPCSTQIAKVHPLQIAQENVRCLNSKLKLFYIFSYISTV